MFFGTTAKQVIFGLPGNPVSSFLCFYRYIQPWLSTMMLHPQPSASAVLAEPFEVKAKDLTYFLQVKVRMEEGRLLAMPIPGGGSGDFANLKEVDGFLEIPASKTQCSAGDSFPYFSFRRA